MKTRLLRDFRDLAPYWLLALAVPAVAYLWPWPPESDPALAETMGDRVYWAGLGDYFAFHALGVLAFSREFDHRTMGFLLTQPVERRTLWRERMGLLLVLLLTAFVADMMILTRQWVVVWDWIARTWTPGMSIDQGKADVPIFYWLTGVTAPPGLPIDRQPRYWTLPHMDWAFGCAAIGAASGFCFGPLTALYLRQTVLAFFAAAIAPAAMFLGLMMTVSIGLPEPLVQMLAAAVRAVDRVFSGAIEGSGFVLLFGVFFGAPPVLAYLLARRKFMRLEVF